jgi:uncharacterized membrane protein (UPF0127 family)
MKKVLLLCSVFVVLLWMSWCSSIWKKSTSQGHQVCFKEQCWEVEIADEVPEQQLGLMNRTEMDEDAWMLFIFPKTWSRQFWMKDTLIPLDIIWLDGAWKVIYVSENTPPCVTPENCPWYWPTSKNALFVLELNAWQAAEYWITTWSALLLPNQ